MSHTVKVPGKLYLAGEYAVVTPGYTAILLTVNRFLTVSVEACTSDSAYIRSTNYSSKKYTWYYQDNTLTFEDWSHPFHLVQTVIHTVEDYIKALNLPLQHYTIDIKSQLDEAGKKIGLGSSGAVTIGVIKALLDLYNISFTNDLIFKLAAIAHVQLKSSGSFGDLAACTYTGIIAYTSLDKNWLKKQLEKHSMLEILDTDWPYFKTEQLTLPKSLKLLIGWTGSPASTESLVDGIYSQNQTEFGQIDFETFLVQSQDCVQTLIQSLKQADLSATLQQVKLNRTLLNQMAQAKDKIIETETLNQLCNIVEAYGGSAKSSGAGGGDCGIGLIEQEVFSAQITKDWSKAGIQQLDLHIVSNGDDSHS